MTHTTHTNYPVGDFLIQIKNAAMARRKSVRTSSTKLIAAVAKVLVDMGYLTRSEVKEGMIEVGLAYHKKEPVLGNLRLVSTPGLRVYRDISEIEKKKGPSSFVISTSKGLLSTRQAIKARMGGEVLVELW